MNHPNVRHLVCPTCDTRAPTADGRFLAHPTSDGSGSNCPNTGRYVNPDTRGNRSPGSAFESCPAATGEANPPCTHFPDGAHRCQHPRKHGIPSAPEHSCTCGKVWISLSGTMADLVDMMDRQRS
jgi:hypothetical protein